MAGRRAMVTHPPGGGRSPAQPPSPAATESARFGRYLLVANPFSVSLLCDDLRYARARADPELDSTALADESAQY